MYLIGVFVCVLLAGASAEQNELVEELKGRGLDVGGGLSMHLDSVPAAENASMFAKHALRFDYRGFGVDFGVDEKQDGLKVGLYYGEEGRGRKNKMNELIVPALLGFKTTTLVVVSLFGMALFVLKALTIAKVALVLAGLLWLSKIYGKHHHHHSPEYEHHSSELHPVYAEYPGDLSELGYAQTAAGSYVAYSGGSDDPSDIGSASSQHYAYVEAPINNSSSAGQDVHRRRDPYKKNPQPVHTFITVRRKTVEH